MREYGDDTPDYFQCAKCGRTVNDRHWRVSQGTPCDVPIEADYGKLCTGLFWPIRGAIPTPSTFSEKDKP